MTTERLVDVTALEVALQKFADERDWQKFHSPKNLAMALTGEVGELVEIFQWMTDSESKRASATPLISVAIGDEIADVLIYLVRMASVLKIDLNSVVASKLSKNAQKYPPAKQISKKSSKRPDS
jgi:dCTP diphosphatase